MAVAPERGLVSPDPAAPPSEQATQGAETMPGKHAEPLEQRDQLEPVLPPRLRPGYGFVSALFLGVVLFAAVIVAVTWWSEPRRFLVLLERANPWWLVPVVLLQALTYFVAGASWRVALDRGGVTLPHRDLSRTALAKLAFDQLIPTGGASGTAFLVYALRRRGVPGALAFAVLFVEWAGYTSGYILAVACAVGLLGWRGDVHPAVISLVVVFALFMAGRVLGLLIARHLPHRRWPRWLTRFPVVALVLSEAAAAPRDVSTSAPVMVKSTLWHFLIYLLDAGTLFVCLIALGSAADPADVFVAFMVASLVATVGVLPGGLGAFEAASVAMLASRGTPVEDALAATVLLRGFTYWLPMIPGVILAKRQIRGDAPRAPRASGAAPSPPSPAPSS